MAEAEAEIEIDRILRITWSFQVGLEKDDEGISVVITIG